MRDSIRMIKRFDYTPILGWSISRYDVFQMCKRQYYYSYYGKYDLDIPIKKINSLKIMTSIPLSIGIIVHNTIKVLLERLRKSEDSINEERFFDFVNRKMIGYCESNVFMEVYYNEIELLKTEKVLKKVKLSLDNLSSSNRFQWLLKKAIYNKNKWIIEPKGYGETRIKGMKAYCKVDFLFPVEDDIFIFDWKTGRLDNSKHKHQLIGYASYASYHFDKDPTKIIPIIAYLQPEYRETELSLNEFDIQEFTSRVKFETEEMYEFCINIEENIPTDKEVFAQTSNSAICNYCNYRELCNI